MKASSFFTKEQQTRILLSVKEAETATSGEIRVHIETTCSEGEKSDRSVLNQEPKEEKTSWGNAAEMYCKRPCAIKPV